MSFLSSFLGDVANTEQEGSQYLYATRSGEPEIDQWSGFDQRLSEGPEKLRTPPSWVRKKEDIRRVLAYRVAAAVQEGVTRYFHESDGPSSDYDQLREHGHAASYIERYVASIVGEAPSIRVADIDEEIPDSVPLPPKPVAPASDADPVETMAYDTSMEAWRRASTRVTAKFKDAAERHDDLLDLQEWFDQWASDSQFWELIDELEGENTTPLGDGVIVLENAPDGTPELRLFEPDGFFKVFDPSQKAQSFPDRVHMCWEWTSPIDNFVSGGSAAKEKRTIRRLTWELLPAANLDNPEAEATWKPAYASERTNIRCFFTDAEWNAEATYDGIIIGNMDVDDLPLEAAKFKPMVNPLDPSKQVAESKRVPLPVDFIPVVHFRHSGNKQWGRSPLPRIMSLLDDQAMADTSNALLHVLVGEPPLVLSGSSVDEDQVLGAAVSIDVGVDGKATKLGFADELRAGIEYAASLERQVQKMTYLSSEQSGQGNNEQSGRAIVSKQISHQQAVLRARRTRKFPTDLLLKYVQRLAIVGKAPGFKNTEVHPASIKWGTFIPEDLSGLIESLVLLRDRGILTDADMYGQLVLAGMQIEDIDASLNELRSINVKVADPLAKILGPKEAAEFMGREFDEDAVLLGGNAEAESALALAETKPAGERSEPVPTP